MDKRIEKLVEEADAGTITILGGTIEARAGYDSDGSAAGIGGGGAQQGTSQKGGEGGIITILGGRVSAFGSPDMYYFQENGGAGIGGGAYGTDSGTITITDGVVNADGFWLGAGIGGGQAGRVGDITISGGVVNAKSSKAGTAIGVGNGANSGNINISGGFVTASVSSDNGNSAIGGWKTKITISGGVVVALAGQHGAIAGTHDRDDGNGSLFISGGTIIGTGYGIGKGSESTSNIQTTVTGGIILATDGNITTNLNNGIAIGDSAVEIDPDSNTIKLKASLTVPDGATFTVPPGWTLDCDSSETITLLGNAKIVSDGATVNVNIVGPVAPPAT
jgi:hypothetical protein